MKVAVLFFALSLTITAQIFKVEKVNGEVLVLKGTSENYSPVKAGDELSAKDMIITGEKAAVHLRKGTEKFILKNNSALNLNSIKKLSINELLLALAMEEIKAVPKKSNSEMKNTAVYGSSRNNSSLKNISPSGLGLKKLNGAKQLAESGFIESAILSAREIFRRHPETRKAVTERLYFARLFESLNLTDEAYNEYSAIYDLNLNPDEKRFVSAKLETLISK